MLFCIRFRALRSGYGHIMNMLWVYAEIGMRLTVKYSCSNRRYLFSAPRFVLIH